MVKEGDDDEYVFVIVTVVITSSSSSGSNTRIFLFMSHRFKNSTEKDEKKEFLCNFILEEWQNNLLWKKKQKKQM